LKIPEDACFMAEPSGICGVAGYHTVVICLDDGCGWSKHIWDKPSGMEQHTDIIRCLTSLLLKLAGSAGQNLLDLHSAAVSIKNNLTN